jgi:hypothetical protein
MMQQAILYAIKGRFRGATINDDVIRLMVTSTKYDTFLHARPGSQKNETVKFLTELMDSVGSSPEFDDQLELIAMYNLSGTLLRYEQELQKNLGQARNLIETHLRAHPESQLRPDLLAGISTYLPFETDMVHEFREAKEVIQAGLLERDVDALISLKDYEGIILSAKQKKIVEEIRALLAELLPQQEKTASIKPQQ